MDRLPVVIWSRLHFDLEPYLTERSADGTSLLAFYHRQFSEAVKTEYLPSDNMSKRHELLAAYFYQKADPQSDRSWISQSSRPFNELTYHVINSRHQYKLDIERTPYGCSLPKRSNLIV